MIAALQWRIDALFITLAAAALAIGAYCAWRNISRAQRKGPAIGLEALRQTLIILALATIADPARVEELVEKEPRRILLITDETPSMGTRDVVVQGQDRPSLRSEMASALAADPQVAALGKRFDLSRRNFGQGDADTRLGDVLAEAAQAPVRPHAIVLLSDGSSNAGMAPAEAGRFLRAAGIGVYSVGLGADAHLPDLQLVAGSLPSFGLARERLVLPFSVRNHLDHDFSGVVRLTSKEGLSLERSISVPAGGQLSDSFIWQSPVEGRHELLMELPPLTAEEADLTNNSVAFVTTIRSEVIKVLVVETLPRWEYRFLRNALQRDPGVELHTVLFHQTGLGIGGGKGYLPGMPAAEELSSYDVIFLGDVGLAAGQLSADDIKRMHAQVVDHGAGLVFLPGPQGLQQNLSATALDELNPVLTDAGRPNGIGYISPGRLRLTSAGMDHMLTLLADTPGMNLQLWSQLPGYYWCAAAQEARLGVTVLAESESINADGTRMPLLAIADRGNGTALFLGTDNAWRWRKGVEDRYHYRFWGQVVRSMANRRHASHTGAMRLFVTPLQPQTGATVDLQVTLGADYQARKDLALPCRLRRPDGSVVQALLSQDPASPGLFRGRAKLDAAGSWVCQIQVPGTSLRHEESISVGGRNLEVLGEPRDMNLLRQLATFSGGQACDAADAPAMLERLVADVTPKPIIRRDRLIQEWWWAALILALGLLYWAWRKRLGLI